MAENVIITNTWKGKLLGVVSQRWAYHGLFWGILLLILMAIEGIGNGFWFMFTNELITLSFYAAIVYFNLYYLIPNFLDKKQFNLYIILLMSATLVVTLLRVVIFYLKFAKYPLLQEELIEHQLGYFITSFFFASSSTVLKIVSDWLRHTQEKQEMERQTIQTELRFLRSQINPHFLFNTLNSLYALSLKKADEAPDMILKLSEIMRYMLYDCNERLVPLHKEISYIRNYLDLERVRHGSRAEIEFTVEGEVTDQAVSPFMFTPFLENSFKHGVGPQLSGSFVHIQLWVDDDQVAFNITNSKPERKPQPGILRSGGIGMVNVKRRLELLYPEKYDLKIEDTPNTYGVTLNLELTAK